MKKPAPTLLLVLFSAGIAHAQGSVQFRNFYSGTMPPVDGRVWLFPGDPRGTFPDGSNPLWRAALVGGPTDRTPWTLTSPGTLQMMFSPVNTTVSWVNFRSGTRPPAAPGYVDVGQTVARAVPGVDWYETALVQMVVWEGNYNDFASAWQAAQSDPLRRNIGVSNPLRLWLFPGDPSPNLVYLWGLQPFAFGVPEPSVWALIGLAGLAGFVCRKTRTKGLSQ